MTPPTPPAINYDTRAVQLSAAEYEALLDRVNPDVNAEGRRLSMAGRYQFTLFPVTFWVKRDEWETHALRFLLHNCAAKWKDVLTEPTLQKLRALMPEAAQPEREE